MKRVAVVGPGGAGKSTFSEQLGDLTGLPVIHLDGLFWKPGWVETAADDWRAIQADLVARESWILDGNYGGSFDVRFARADTVIILAPPRWQCISRAVTRISKNHGRAIQADGCPERFQLAFLRWIWRYPIDSRPRLDAALEERSEGLQVFELTTADEVSGFLDDVRAHATPASGSRRAQG